MKKKSLIPKINTINVESYVPEPTGIIVKEFYDPDFKPTNSIIAGTGLSIEKKPVYRDKTVKQLKVLAKNKGLKVSGTRKQLIKRIADNSVAIQKEGRQKKLDAKKEQELGVKNKTDSINNILNTRLKKLSTKKDRAQQQLFQAQKSFDSIEAEYNEVNITLNSLKKLF